MSSAKQLHSFGKVMMIVHPVASWSDQLWLFTVIEWLTEIITADHSWSCRNVNKQEISGRNRADKQPPRTFLVRILNNEGSLRDVLCGCAATTMSTESRI
ncbi:hypothetical protein pipiens_004136 [Culex pipiens pipiens]|uniref:Uncharacterized protein n=1 Tax=Culex pipiens pipiens TaxID=38569 RepID=A0ABD1CNN0_CULPP